MGVRNFCGGSRNHAASDEFGARPEERALVLRVHATREDLPATGTSIDATRPLAEVVDEILLRAGLIEP